MLPSWNTFIKWLVAPSTSATRPLPISLLFSETSLSLLCVTWTHFTPSSYERALNHSIFLSYLATLGVKPRFFTSSWRVLRPITCLFFLLLEKFSLLALPLLLRTHLPFVQSQLFPLHGLALSLLFITKVGFSYLDSLPSHNLD